MARFKAQVLQVQGEKVYNMLVILDYERTPVVSHF
jgi:hypothetical protein